MYLTMLSAGAFPWYQPLPTAAPGPTNVLDFKVTSAEYAGAAVVTTWPQMLSLNESASTPETAVTANSYLY